MDSHYNSSGLLLGYALENVLKGRRLVRGGVLADVENPGKWVRIKDVKEHDLRPLAKKVGVELNAQEDCVVDRLSYWITVAGRYPIPMRAAEMKPEG